MIRLAQTLLRVCAFAIVVRWGIVAVAVVYTASAYLFAPVALLVLKKLIDLDLVDYLRRMLLPLAASLLMALGVGTVRHFLGSWDHPGILVFLYTAMGVIIYGVVIRLIAPSLLQSAIELALVALPLRRKPAA